MGVVIGPRAYATSEEPVRFSGHLFLCGSGTSRHTISLASTVRLHGGSYWVDQPALGDRVSLEVMTPDGQVAAVYCRDLPVPPFQALVEIDSPTTGLVEAGWSLCLVYDRASPDPCNVGLTLRWFEV